MVTEVKASQSNDSPPSVVCDSEDSLLRQERSILGCRKRLVLELNWVYKHCRSDDRQLVARTLIKLSLDQIQLVAAPVLVRSNSSYTRNDFGCFETDPDQFAPANVDFVILRLPGDIEELASNVYARARAVE